MRFSQSDIKRLYRFFLLREQFHNLNTCGLYKVSLLKKAAEKAGLKYHTVRADISYLETRGGIVKENGYIKLNTLKGEIKRLYRLWIRLRKDIEASDKPAIYLSDLYKRKIIYGNVIAQANKEVDKLNEKGSRNKLLQTVKDNKTSIGERQGIYLSLETIGRLLNRSKTTAFSYIKRIHETGIMSRQLNLRFVCGVDELVFARAAENLYGRLKVKDGKVYERLQNSYTF